jgi:glucose/arabinose dehydrogenase
MNKLLLPLAGIAVVAALAGCTNAADDATATSSPTASSAAAADTEAPPTGTCTDGQALITGNEVKDGKATLPDGCENVYVLVDDTTIEIGPTTKLAFEGIGNTVTYTGDAPEILGGENNTVTAG